MRICSNVAPCVRFWKWWKGPVGPGDYKAKSLVATGDITFFSFDEHPSFLWVDDVTGNLLFLVKYCIINVMKRWNLRGHQGWRDKVMSLWDWMIPCSFKYIFWLEKYDKSGISLRCWHDAVRTSCSVHCIALCLPILSSAGCQFRVPDQDMYWNPHDTGRVAKRLICGDGKPRCVCHGC